MQGKIIKGIAGDYFVHVAGRGIYVCKAKGNFRHKKLKPLVGDNVEIDILSEDNKTGNIINIMERNSQLIRPAVSNIDQALVVFAAKSPAPNLNLLDRFLVMMESSDIRCIIVFNKIDLIDSQEKSYIDNIKRNYEKAGYRCLFISTYENTGIDLLREILKDRTTSMAGPSGVGKSSLINALCKDAHMETGDISRKIERGKHTTRHSEIFTLSDINEDTYLMDTPGFTSVFPCECEKEDLRYFFPEFQQYEGKCRFNGCVHINEPECAVKEAVASGDIGSTRYENYKLMFEEIKNQRKY